MSALSTTVGFAHLTLADHVKIEFSIKEKLSVREIASQIGKSHSTVLREIRTNQTIKKAKPGMDCCLHVKCKKRSMCHEKCKDLCKNKCKHWLCNPKNCPDHQKTICDRLQEDPYHLCNLCPKKAYCNLEQHIYNASDADKKAQSTLRDSRSGFCLTGEELKQQLSL